MENSVGQVVFETKIVNRNVDEQIKIKAENVEASPLPALLQLPKSNSPSMSPCKDFEESPPTTKTTTTTTTTRLSILALPPEMLEKILEDKCLGIQDIVNFGLCCQQCYQAVFHSKKLWKVKIQAVKKENRTKKLLKQVKSIRVSVIGMITMDMLRDESDDSYSFDCDDLDHLLNDAFEANGKIQSKSSESDLTDCFLE